MQALGIHERALLYRRFAERYRIMAFKFQGFDFLQIDSGLSEDELLVRRTAREFVEDKLIPVIEDCFREGRFPR